MSIVRWSPFGEVGLFQNHMNRLFENAWKGWPGDALGTSNWNPPVDIFESDGELTVNLDLPGVDPKNVDVSVENNVLTIRGERRFEEKQDKENYHRVERSYGSFARSFTLSTRVDADKIRANYNAGVLTVTLPKAEAAKPKKIEIGIAAA